MSRLTAFRDHCRKMAAAQHRPECPMRTWRPPYWCGWIPEYVEGDAHPHRLVWAGPRPTTGEFVRPACDGCNPAEDRALFARLAGEVDTYLDRALFEESTEETS